MRKLLLAVLLLSGVMYGQTQIASDPFTYSNGALQTVSGGNWTETGQGNAWTVSSNALTNTSTGGSTTVVYGEKWTGAGTFSPDQYAEVTLNSSSSTTRFGGVILRATGDTYYFFVCASTNCKAGKWNGSSITSIQGAVAHGLTFPLTLHAEITGSTLSFKVNGSTPSGFSATYTDSTYTSGNPGIASNGSTTVTADNFVAGITGNPQASTPSISSSGQTVTITGTGTKCYTEDGSSPAINSSGTCTAGTTYSAPFTRNSTSTVTKAVAGSSTTSQSATASYNWTATPVISPATGSYFTQQSVTMSCSTGSSSIYYTTDGTTPTTSSTAYSGAFNSTSSGSQTIKALCVASGLGDSAIASNAYSVAPSDVSIVSDNFSTYYDANIALNYGQQFPLDLTNTAGKWITVGGISGDTGTAESSLRFVSPVRPATASAVTSGYAVGAFTPSGVTAVLAAYAGRTGFSSDQYASAKLPSASSGSAMAGVCVRCDTGGTAKTGYYFIASSGSGNAQVELARYVNGAKTQIAIATSRTIAVNPTVELRVLGATLQPLINGTQPSGLSATYSDTSISTGSPGVAANNGYLSDFSAGNIGVSDSTSETSYPATYPTYTDSAMSTSLWSTAWPWVQTRINHTVSIGVGSSWGSPFSPVQIGSSGTYAIGMTTNGNGTIAYRGGSFGSDQWQKHKIGIEPHDTNMNWWLSELQHKTYVPGTDGGCATAGTTESCYDVVAYYIGVSLWAKRIALSGASIACSPSQIKNEYGCTPFLHITKVTPASSPGDEVITVAGTQYTPRIGDEIYEEYLGGKLNVACKGNASNYINWSPSTAYSLDTYRIDSHGNWQRVVTAGTSGSSTPTWGSTWTQSSASGSTTSDGTVVWEYMGQPCATSDRFSWVINAPDSDLHGANGIPGLAASALNAGGSNVSAPIFYDWSAGTATSGTSLSVIGLAEPSTYQPAPVVMW